jgi:S1-C subfamily serine protease
MSRLSLFSLKARDCLLMSLLLAVQPLAAGAGDEPQAPTFQSGWVAYNDGEFSRAAKIWTELAGQGHISSQINLGYMYDYGIGVVSNYQRAAFWYRSAAEQGSAAGQYNLALLIMEGRAQPEPDRGAVYWLEKAAAQGYEDAREQLGLHSEFTETNAYAADPPVSVGTAWPVATGYAVTNHHVIDGKRTVRLVSRKGRELTARVVASDPVHDIAFLKVTDVDALPEALPLSTHRAPLGTSVFTIGFPRIDIMGKSPKLSQGIIASENGLLDDPDTYQISVPIQPGNSGGPLLNMRGEVVGMITAMLGQISDESVEAYPIPNISYALKIEVVRNCLENLSATAETAEGASNAPLDLELLAARIQDSVLIVMAE